jgi:hypothetical protein
MNLNEVLNSTCYAITSWLLDLGLMKDTASFMFFLMKMYVTLTGNNLGGWF